MKAARLCLLGTAIGAIVGPTAALASEDDKMYPGAACQPSTSTDKILRRSNGGIYNGGTANQIWVCPVVRDNNSTGSIEFARITVVDPRPSTICTLFSRTSTGGLYGSLTGSSTTLTGTRLMNFGLGDANAVRVAKDGYAYFRCTVPPGSGILTYLVSENVSED